MFNLILVKEIIIVTSEASFTYSPISSFNYSINTCNIFKAVSASFY